MRKVGVFAKAPVAGLAKTRLAARLGSEGAARLQQQLTTRALQRACRLPETSVELWIDGPADHPFVLQSARDFDVVVRPQQGKDLGARMAHAFAAMLAEAGRVLIIGTDCPAQRTADLADAFTALDAADVVVQPAEDGGYVLIGAKRLHAPLFEAVPWGTERVLTVTRERAAAANLLLKELPLSWDLDHPADFDRALAAGLVDEP
jgi:uncharacterized protein